MKSYMIRNYKNSLVEPLDGEELHIISSNAAQESALKKIMTILNEELYGIYLLGGMRGAGKTSLINVAKKIENWRTPIYVHINCNKLISAENFIYFLVSQMLEEMKGKNIGDKILKQMYELKKDLYYNRMKEEVNENIGDVSESIRMMDTKEITTESGWQYFKSLKGLVSRNVSKIQEREQIVRNNKRQTDKLQEKNDLFIIADKLSKLLYQIPREEGKWHFVIVLDELDKQNPQFIQEIINNYKDLFFNSKLIMFLIVDSVNYINMLRGNELENPFKSYLTDSIYLPSLGYNELREYLFREFNASHEIEIMHCYYTTLGILRKVNMYQYTKNQRESEDSFLKVVLFHDLMIMIEQKEKNENFDLLKIVVKDLIDVLVQKKSLSYEEITSYITERKTVFPKEYIDIFVKHINYLAEKRTLLINVGGYEPVYLIAVNWNTIFEMQLQLEKMKIEYKIDNYQVRELNRYMPVQFKYSYICICDHEDMNQYFYQLFFTLYKKMEGIWIIRKVMVPYFEKEESYAYSALLIVNKRIGRIIYGIEDFSFSYESSEGIRRLREFLNGYHIKEILIDIDDEDITDNMDYIVEQARIQIEGKQDADD